jgi:hypothetical protein
MDMGNTCLGEKNCMVIQLNCISYKSSLDLHWCWTWACWLLFCVNPMELLFCDPAVKPMVPHRIRGRLMPASLGLFLGWSLILLVRSHSFCFTWSKARSANLARDAVEPLDHLDVVDGDGLKELHMHVLLQPLAQSLVSLLVDQCCSPFGVEAYSGAVGSLEALGGGVEAFDGLGNVLTNQGVFVCLKLNLVIGLRA